MIADTILHKYMRHLRYLNAGYASLDAVELALRLALDELAESTPSTPSTDQRQTERIMELEAELSELRIKLTRARQDAALDNTAAVINAQLNRRNTELVEQIATLQAEIANLTAYTDAAPPPNPPPAPLPLDLSSLAPDELHQVAAVQSGESKWRTLPKPLRQTVASLTLRQLAAAKGERITQREWEAQRPPWMPGSGSLTYMYDQLWEDIPQE